MSETISLLGESQTFLGIIATLTILCILHKGGNFIREILLLVRKRLQKQIEKLGGIKVSQPEWTEWKLLMFFLSEEKRMICTKKA